MIVKHRLNEASVWRNAALSTVLLSLLLALTPVSCQVVMETYADHSNLFEYKTVLMQQKFCPHLTALINNRK